MTLREKRVLFTRLLCHIVLWAFHQGWEIAFDEVKVFPSRKMRFEGVRIVAEDAMHIKKSFHYQGLAADLLLYINGKYIEDGDHPAWKAIHRQWHSLHPLATEGSGWDDSNHLSLGEGNTL